MRFRPLRIIACLIIGAVMTVGVAWVAAWVVNPDAAGATVSSSAVAVPDEWPYWKPVDVPAIDQLIHKENPAPAWGPTVTRTWRMMRTTWEFKIGDRQYSWTQRVVGLGFPWPAMWKGEWPSVDYEARPRANTYSATGIVGGYSFTHGFTGHKLDVLNADDVRLPLLPLYFGFTLDTLFYGGLTYAIWSFIAAAIGWRRLAHGRCAKCKYPIGVGPVCTECGAKVPGRAAASEGRRPVSS